MANPQHIRWLEEGVDAWNERRTTSNFRPDFANHDFGGRTLFERNREQEPKNWERIPLRGIQLTNAILVGADLRVVDLSNASLYRADLTSASLSQAILTGVDFRFANLSNANFVNADLTGAKFGGYGGKLTNVNLQANVVDADFREADLTDVAWLPSELWKAKLFWPNRSRWQYTGEFSVIETVSDLLDAIKKIKQCHKDIPKIRGETAVRHNRHEDVLLYFRGESKCYWELRPSVMRDEFPPYESAMLRDLISRRPEEFSNTSAALDRWVLAQHHGLRTRFLDVTRNPLVALFHACSEPEATEDNGRIHIFATPKFLVQPYDSNIITIFSNFARLQRDQQLNILNQARHRDSESERRLYHLIRSDIPQFNERIDPRDFYRVFFVEPRRSSERIRAQSGAFLLSAFHERFETEEILKRIEDIPIYEHFMLTIANDSRLNIVEELRELNISHELLFPGLDSSARAIAQHYL